LTSSSALLATWLPGISIRLSEQLGGVGISLGELLSLVSEYHIVSRGNWDELKSLLFEQREQLAGIRDDTSTIKSDTSKLLEETAAIYQKLDHR